MGIWGWVGTVAAIWFAASVLAAIAWGTVGKRIFRSRPVAPNSENVHHIDRRGGER